VAAIDTFVLVSLASRSYNNIRRSYSNLEMVDTIDQTEHRYSRGGALVQLKGRQHFTWSRRTGL